MALQAGGNPPKQRGKAVDLQIPQQARINTSLHEQMIVCLFADAGAPDDQPGSSARILLAIARAAQAGFRR